MIRTRAYIPIDDILTIFQIPINVAKEVIKKHKIDSFSSKGKLKVNAKDFYKAYVAHFNPSLLDLNPERKKKIEKKIKEITSSNIFESIFVKPYKTTIKSKKIIQISLNLHK